jgi:hypothetical protein
MVAGTLAGGLPGHAGGNTVFTADEQTPPFSDIQAQIAALQSTPSEGKIRGTYSTKHLFDTYSAGVQHVQGIAWLSDNRMALSHNSRSGKKALIVVSDGQGDCNMITVGTGNHPGAIQAAGKVIAVPIYGNGLTGSEIVFVDARDKNRPTAATLTHLRITYTGNTLGSAGIVFDPVRKVHWVVASTRVSHGTGGTALFWKSNGRSLFDNSCRFELVASNFSAFISQGGTQLLMDAAGAMFVAALYRNSSGVEHVALTSITDPGPSAKASVLVDNALSDSGLEIDYSAGFRWGGTIAKMPNGSICAIGVSRLLTYGPLQKYAKTRVWR